MTRLTDPAVSARDWVEPTAPARDYESACFDRILDTANVEIVARFTINGDPASKARARFTRYGSSTRTYTPEKTRTAEEAVAWAFKATASEHVPDDTHAYGLACVFFSASFQRRDVDNMLKLVGDGLNGVAWADDAQVYEVTGRRGSDTPQHARTEVLVYRIGPKWNPTAQCTYCGEAFQIYKSSRPKYCGSECRTAALRERRMRTCMGCGTSFDGRTVHYKAKYCSRECRDQSARQAYACVTCGGGYSHVQSLARMESVRACSPECRVEYYRTHPPKRTRGECGSCGGPTSRKEYVRCRACQTANRPKKDLRSPVDAS